MVTKANSVHATEEANSFPMNNLFVNLSHVVRTYNTIGINFVSECPNVINHHGRPLEILRMVDTTLIRLG